MNCISAVAAASTTTGDDHLPCAQPLRDRRDERHDGEAAARLCGGQDADDAGAVARFGERERREGEGRAGAQADDGDAENEREKIAGEDGFHDGRDATPAHGLASRRCARSRVIAPYCARFSRAVGRRAIRAALRNLHALVWLPFARRSPFADADADARACRVRRRALSGMPAVHAVCDAWRVTRIRPAPEPHAARAMRTTA
ncbi:hypothetical protein PMC2000_15120 [Burkholderia pseudomallei]|nr:hypothetical protein [Burkholderia pseudomallei]QGS79789.1 hypothetical protein PMC2000_15120 [Burkholderia pseudomallei]QGT05482.1 hypothetical protein D286_14895 [Burkholderia pseudomallei]